MAHVRFPSPAPVRRTFAGSLVIALVLMASLGVLSPALAAAERYAAIVIDANTGKTLFERNADDPRYPASLTKMMTLYILFEELTARRMSLATPLKVSAHASAQAPSKMGLKPGQTITAGEAIRALVVKSANDVAVVVAENISGSEDAFARRMTQTARSIGMRNTTFRNASGLPDPGQKTTARDMATLGIALRARHPTLYRFFSTTSFQFRGQTIRGHNRLLGRVEGVDGIKTGFIRLSGFNLVTSVNRNGRLLVATVMGGQTARARDAHMAELIEAYLPKASIRLGNTVKAAPGSYNDPRRGELPVASRSQPVVAAAPAPLPDAKGPPHRLVPEEAGDIGDDDEAMEGPDTVGALTAAPPVPVAAVPRTTSQKSSAKAAGTKVASLDNAQIVVAPKKPATKAKPAAPVEEDTAAAAPSKGGWAIQIGAVPTAKAATDLLSRARSSAAKALKGAESYTQKVEGSKTLYRARFGGFSSQSTANAACAALSAKQFPCMAMRQ
ncbi:SPOR domain-containing protein [Segnochrobactraceae bacterium EtOH-i3]